MFGLFSSGADFMDKKTPLKQLTKKAATTGKSKSTT